jgi:hypothetical protein
MPVRFKWKRREFLRNSVIAGLLAPVAAYWRDLPEARAQDDRRHLVTIFLPNGKVRENPFVEGSGTAYSFAEGFSAYNAFRDRCIAIQEYGFQTFINAHYDGDHGGHVAPGCCMFTGDVSYTSGGAGSVGLAPSIDQIVAWDYLDRGVITNPLRKSLSIKITGSSFRSPSVFFQTPADYSLGRTYTGMMTPVTLIDRPVDGFERMFGDLTTMSTEGDTAADLWAQGKSILDVPAAEIRRIQPNLPSDGRAILEQHLHSLRELEVALADDTTTVLVPPDAPTDIARTPDNHERIIQQWWQVVDAALRFDRTRIVSVQFGGIASRFHVPALGLGFVGTSGDSNSGSDHHSYTHHSGAVVPRFMDWFAARIAELLTEMTGTGAEAKPDILRDSVVAVGMEFGWNHNASDVPVTLFGEAGGYFETGKVVRYGNDLANYHKHTGTLLGLAHAMGVDRLTTVGRNMPEYQRGVVPELLASG